MKIIKTKLRNKISDGWLNDLMVCYTEWWYLEVLIVVTLRKIFERRVELWHCLGLVDGIKASLSSVCL
jgi:hypothetical protein